MFQARQRLLNDWLFCLLGFRQVRDGAADKGLLQGFVSGSLLADGFFYVLGDGGLGANRARVRLRRFSRP